MLTTIARNKGSYISWCHFIFSSIELQTPLVLQSSHKTTGNIHNPRSMVICCFCSNNAIMSLQVSFKGNCYLVFHIHDSGSSWGRSIDFIFFLFWHHVPVFLHSFVDTSSQFWRSCGCCDIFPNRSVWSEAVWREEDNLSQAPWTGLRMSSSWYGKVI